MAPPILNAADLFSVRGMVFVVTGAGSGIGKIMAHALDQNGAAKVYILGRRLEKLQAVAKEALNGSIVPIQCDATSNDDLAAAAKKVEAESGFVNAVIANSGITGPRPDPPKDREPSIEEIQADFWQHSQEDFTKPFAVNDTAMFYTMVAFLHLLDAGNKSDKSPCKTDNSKGVAGIKSQFIATSSIGGFHRKPLAGFAYNASKAACTHLVKNLATFLVPYHIRANVIAPGLYPSEMNDVTDAVEGIKEGALPSSLVPLTRVGTVEDMAGAILSLCSRAGAYYNGFALVTDGGRLSVLPSTY